MTDRIQTAQDRFAQGFNCSQAVLSTFASELGIPTEAALKLASPFGGGVARQGQVCGAVIGALMALGLVRGSATVAEKEEAYAIARTFLVRFQERHGTLLCRELLGYDISKPDGLQNAREQKVFVTFCPGLVKEATELVEEILS